MLRKLKISAGLMVHYDSCLNKRSLILGLLNLAMWTISVLLWS